jgi:serine/threonine protein phosphatase PrpC
MPVLFMTINNLLRIVLRINGEASRVTANLRVGNAQVIGARPEQQDAFGFTDKDDACFVRHGGVVAVVADGMGGHAHGGDASRIAVQTFLHDYMAKPEHVPISSALDQAFLAANQAVCTFATKAGASENCGTTLIAAAVHPASLSLHWIGTGDSRIFLFREPQWVQITIDTNYGTQLLSNQIRGIPLGVNWNNDGHPQGLTGFLGQQGLAQIDRSLRGFRLHPGDWLVLCTDGVYNALTHDEMVECLNGEPNHACERIIEKVSAKNLTHQDNATVAIVACDFGAYAVRPHSWGNWLKAIIARLGFRLLLVFLLAIAFSLGVYAGHGWLRGN